MRKIVGIILLCPVLLCAQPKSEWTFYGPSFSYEKDVFMDKTYNTLGITDVIFRADGSMIFSFKDGPIVFVKDGKEYKTSKIVFEKEGAKGGAFSGGGTDKTSSMVLDKNGNLWFATLKGLHRMNAEIFSDLDKMKEPMGLVKGVKFSDETPGLPFGSVTQVSQDSKGNLWVTGARIAGVGKLEYKGLSKWDGTSWVNMPVTSDDNKEVTAFIFDGQDNPIAVTTGIDLISTVSWYKDGQWKSLGQVGKDKTVSAMTFGNNTLYASSGSSLFAWKNDKWENIENLPATIKISDIKVDKDNDVWVASNAGAACFRPSGAKYYIEAANSPLPINDIRKLIIDDQDRKIFVTDGGIVAFKEAPEANAQDMNNFTKFNSAVPDEKIEYIIQGKDALLLVGATQGLAKFDGKTFSLITPVDQREVYFTNVAIDKAGTAYIGTYRYLHKSGSGSYSKWDWKDDTGKQISNVLVDSQDKIWIASDGVSRFDGTAWQNFNKKNAGLSSNAAYKLFQDSKGNIWAALYDGLAKYDGTSWTGYNKKSAGVALGNMTGMAESKDGKLWFSNGYKLIEFDGTAMKETAGFKAVGTLKNMIADADGTLIIATEENGIAKVKDGVVTYCNQTTCGLPSNAINFVYRDPAGVLWASYGLPPKNEAFSTMSMDQGQQAKPAPVVSPKEAFTKKIKSFEPAFGLVQIKKM